MRVIVRIYIFFALLFLTRALVAAESVCSGILYEPELYTEITVGQPIDISVQLDSNQFLNGKAVLLAGESVELEISKDTKSRDKYLWCVSNGALIPKLESPLFDEIKYVAPLVDERVDITLTVSVIDRFGVVSGDTVELVVLPKHSSEVSIAVAQTSGNNSIGLYSVTGNQTGVIDTKTSGEGYAIAAVDANSDGIFEGLAGAPTQGGSKVYYFLYDGRMSDKDVTASGIRFASGDLDSDGLADLAIATNSANLDSLDTYESTSGGNLTSTITAFDKNGPMSLALGDVDGDSRPDILAGGMGSHTNDLISIIDADGDRSELQVFTTTGVNGNPGVQVFSGDLNCDGTDEIGAAMTEKSSWIEIRSADGALITSFEAFPNGRNKGVVAVIANVMSGPETEIIIGEYKSNRVAIFDKDGNKLKEFTVNEGTITDLAVNRSNRCGDPDVINGAASLNTALETMGFSALPPTAPIPSPDTDGDGLSDDDENDIGSDPNNPDSDGDGASDGEEVGHSKYDPYDTTGNGTPDVLDATTATVRDQLGGYVRIRSSKGKLKNVHNSSSDGRGEIPEGLRLDKPKYGLFEFDVIELNGGDTIQVTMQFDNLDGVEAYLKDGKYGWFEFKGVVIDTENNLVTLTLTDNKLGDSNDTSGVISDPGGPTSRRAPVAVEPIEVPVMTGSLLGLLALLTFGLGFRQFRRKED